MSRVFGGGDGIETMQHIRKWGFWCAAHRSICSVQVQSIVFGVISLTGELKLQWFLQCSYPFHVVVINIVSFGFQCDAYGYTWHFSFSGTHSGSSLCFFGLGLRWINPIQFKHLTYKFLTSRYFSCETACVWALEHAFLRAQNKPMWSFYLSRYLSNLTYPDIYPIFLSIQISMQLFFTYPDICSICLPFQMSFQSFSYPDNCPIFYLSRCLSNLFTYPDVYPILLPIQIPIHLRVLRQWAGWDCMGWGGPRGQH